MSMMRSTRVHQNCAEDTPCNHSYRANAKREAQQEIADETAMPLYPSWIEEFENPEDNAYDDYGYDEYYGDESLDCGCCSCCGCMCDWDDDAAWLLDPQEAGADEPR
jgi:hypothetical protein